MLLVARTFGPSSLLAKVMQRGLCSMVAESEYEKKSSESLEKISSYMDTFPERFEVSPEFDVNCAMGVLTVVISKEDGTYVINKQSPNKQLWLSSPISGPKRYDLVRDSWVYAHDGEALDTLLTREFRKIFASDDIDFKTHI